MRKLFTLIGALLLWHTAAVAQNYLHIWTGDTTKIVRMAQLDSVTVRDAEFYKIDLSNVDGLRFTGNVADYFGSEFEFDVTLAKGEGTTVYIRNLDPFFAQSGFTADGGYNILMGELVVAEDGNSATIICQLDQPIGYEDFVFHNPFNPIEGETIEFTMIGGALICETGYGVYTYAQSAWLMVFNPFTLNKVAGTAAPARKAKAMEAKPLKIMKQPIPMMAPRKQDAATTKMGALQLKPMPADQTIK